MEVKYLTSRVNIVSLGTLNSGFWRTSITVKRYMLALELESGKCRWNVLHSATSNVTIDGWLGWNTSLAEGDWNKLTLLGDSGHWGLSCVLVIVSSSKSLHLSRERKLTAKTATNMVLMRATARALILNCMFAVGGT
jgi:hypothetical protein